MPSTSPRGCSRRPARARSSSARARTGPRAVRSSTALDGMSMRRERALPSRPGRHARSRPSRPCANPSSRRPSSAVRRSSTLLEMVAARVRRERVPQLVTLFGLAGVGKSRLVGELLARVPAVRVLKGRCLPYGEGITYWPLAEAAKEDADILDTDPAEVAHEKLRTAVHAVVEQGAREVFDAIAWTIGLAGNDSPLSSMDTPTVASALADGWQRYVGALGRYGLTVLVIEDIHWASVALLDLVEHLVDRISEACVVLVCTARPEFLAEHPSWGAGKQNATALSLTPLTADESERLVSNASRRSACAGGRAEPASLQRGGQPLLPRGDAADAHRRGRARTRERRLGRDTPAGRASHPGFRARRHRRAARPARPRGASGTAALRGGGTRLLAVGGGSGRGTRRGPHRHGARLAPARVGHGRPARVHLQARAHPRRRLRLPGAARAAGAPPARSPSGFAVSLPTAGSRAPSSPPTTTGRRSAMARTTRNHSAAHTRFSWTQAGRRSGARPSARRSSIWNTLCRSPQTSTSGPRSSSPSARRASATAAGKRPSPGSTRSRSSRAWTT